MKNPRQIYIETIDPLAEADSAISLLSKALLPKAAELARAGKYQEAEIILQHLILEGGTLPAIYDLLARIRAQQGRLLEAQAQWAEAIRLSSTRELYRPALKRIEQLQSGPAWLGWIRPLLLVLGLFLGIMVIIPAAHFGLSNLKAPVIKAPSFKLPQATEVNAKTIPPELAFNVPGALVTKATGQIIITFQSGVFARRTEIQPEAKVSLDQLAKQLKPYVGRIQVNVEGHTDDIPISGGFTFRDNVSLGLHRAVTVIEYLRLAGGLPAAMFKASSTGEQQSLYPNDTINNKLRNRTVVIKIVGL